MDVPARTPSPGIARAPRAPDSVLRAVPRGSRRRLSTLCDLFTKHVSLCAAQLRDRFASKRTDPGPERAVSACIDWLRRAQDHSAPRDGGVARHFSLIDGWSSSYPETTGYIIPTMLAWARWRGDEDARLRARRMLDWLVSIQFADGAFQGGVIGATPCVPTTFNTGQILLGLSAGEAEFGAYSAAVRRAADWLVDAQDPDGCWRRHPSPFVAPGDKTYDTHLAWGLLEASRVTGEQRYAESALRNVRWAVSLQNDRGWIANCCLDNPSAPLTHTLGYALRGILEAHRFSGDADLLHGAVRMADGLLGALGEDGFLPGRLRSDWTPHVEWACLTGSAQIGECWQILDELKGAVHYREAARRINRYLRRRVAMHGRDGVRGAVSGSSPIDGEYGRYQYLNWAAKFFIDSQMRELQAGSAGGR